MWQLSVGEQQRVEIVKQLYRGRRLLILDEPTAVLAPHESDRLFASVRHMADTGHGVVLVSHKMQEILDHTDRVTVLRDGRNAGHGSTSGLTRRRPEPDGVRGPPRRCGEGDGDPPEPR